MPSFVAAISSFLADASDICRRASVHASSHRTAGGLDERTTKSTRADSFVGAADSFLNHRVAASLRVRLVTTFLHLKLFSFLSTAKQSAGRKA